MFESVIPPMSALSCLRLSFMLSLFSSFLNSAISDLASALVCLLFLSSHLHLEHWQPPLRTHTHLLSSVTVLHRHRMAASASRLSHLKKALVFFSFLISSRCAPSWPPTFQHFIPKLSSSSLFFRLLLLWFHCLFSAYLKPWMLLLSSCEQSCLEDHHHHHHMPSLDDGVICVCVFATAQWFLLPAFFSTQAAWGSVWKGHLSEPHLQHIFRLLR